ncbi:MAG: hypothetical protein B7X41_16055, partial [Microbacterium sp. 14-71-5]
MPATSTDLDVTTEGQLFPMYSLRSLTRAVHRRTARAVRTPGARRLASAPSRAVAQAAAATALAVVGVGTVGGAQLAAAAPSTTSAV